MNVSPFVKHTATKMALGAAVSFLVGSLIKFEHTLKDNLDEQYEDEKKNKNNPSTPDQ